MSEQHKLTYLPLEHFSLRRPVERLKYIRHKCLGKRVLDLGALDETEIHKNQHRTWKWLHREIGRTAREVIGVDSSEALRKNGPLGTPFGTTIRYGKVEDLGDILNEFRPDLIIAGELIEHTADPASWLSAIGQIQPGVTILLSTPNATSIVNIGLSLINREMMHKDHYCIYSYKTLMTLGRRIGLRDKMLTPYYYHTELLRGRAPALLVPGIVMADYLLLTPVQYLFPLTAGGLILEGTFPV
jgi:hypothetical protein